MFGGGAKPIGGGALAPPGPYGSYGPALSYSRNCFQISSTNLNGSSILWEDTTYFIYQSTRD